MKDRIFEDERSWEVSEGNCDVEFYVFDREEHQGEVIITGTEDRSWDSQRTIFTISAEEATNLKEFLIRKGY